MRLSGERRGSRAEPAIGTAPTPRFYVVCSHGGVDPRIPTVADQPLEALLWGAGGFPDAYEGGRRVVNGHRNNADIMDDGWPWPRVKSPTIGIDTISHAVLTAYMWPEGRVIQSRRHLV